MASAFIHRSTGLIVQIEIDAMGPLVAHVPQLPGCVSQGDTVAEALGNIDDAIMGVLSVMREDGRIGGLSIHQNQNPLDGIEYSTETQAKKFAEA